MAGLDAILVGDSMSMVVQGHATTLPVTLDEMIYHAEMVGRAVQHALVIVDLPFPTNHLGPYKAVEFAGRILKEARVQAVKLEGGAEQAEVISALNRRRHSGHGSRRPAAPERSSPRRLQSSARRRAFASRCAISARCRSFWRRARMYPPLRSLKRLLPNCKFLRLALARDRIAMAKS